MALRSYISMIYYVLIILVIVSCHALVDDEFQEFEKKPVLNGVLIADSTISLQVTFSASLNDSTPLPVENAIVILFSKGLTDTLLHDKVGWYKSDQTAMAGQLYRCVISIPGYDTVSAETIVPKPTEISNIQFTDFAGLTNEGEKISSYRVTISNDTAQSMYWDVRMIEEGIHTMFNWDTQKLEERFFANYFSIYMIPGKDIVMLNEASPLTIFSNQMMDENRYDITFYYSEELRSGYDNYIELRSIDRSYYEFQKQYYLYYTADFDQIGSSPQNYPLYSNVTNGLGIFTAYSATRWNIKP